MNRFVLLADIPVTATTYLITVDTLNAAQMHISHCHSVSPIKRYSSSTNRATLSKSSRSLADFGRSTTPKWYEADSKDTLPRLPADRGRVGNEAARFQLAAAD